MSEQDLKVMSEAVEVLSQFKGFSYFSGMSDIVSRLKDHVTSAKQKTTSVIDFEKNENLQGLNYLDAIYHSIVDKQVLRITYQSFKAREAATFIFYPYLLKEYKNRWFVFGLQQGQPMLKNLALDRIQILDVPKNEPYKENSLFDPLTFFEDVVGVTKNVNQQAETVTFSVTREHAPYIRTKPIHKSQQIIETKEDGAIIFEINVIINQELQREFLGFADGIQILSPNSLVRFMKKKFKKAQEIYENTVE